jgi:small subunit ribosomal protein S8
MNTDPIADMLTRLRNANRAGHQTVRIPYSVLKHEILKVFSKNHFVGEVRMEKSGEFNELLVTLANRPQPLEIKRISKPGQRIYVHAKKIPKVLNGLGLSVLSTPKGVLSHRDAAKENVGGELLCEIA